MVNRMTETRPLDDLGRVVIPRPICEVFGWAEGTRLEVSVDASIAADAVILRAASPFCSLCRERSGDLAKVEKGYVCAQCAAKIK